MNINSCSSCGGIVEFSPKYKALKCINCERLYPIEYKRNIVKHPVGGGLSQFDMEQWKENNSSYKCQNCGATIVLNKMDISTSCQYCNTSSLVPIDSLPGLKPEIVIPFKICKEDAKTEFYKRIKKRKFLPFNFKKNLPSAEVGSTYISSFTFAMTVTASYKGTLRTTKNIKGSDGKIKTIYEFTPISGDVVKQLDNLVVEASDKLNQDEISSVLPYDFDDCYDYNDDFVKGYNVGYYNQTVEQAEEVAKRDALSIIERHIRSKYSNSINDLVINAQYLNILYNYALLPTYFISFNYKKKSYINVMNGQTGKVGGKVPRSGLQITLFVLFIILVIGLPILFMLL